MKISKRQREILEFLLQQTEEVTAGEIALEMNVSTRTILRELTVVEKWLEVHHIKLEKKSGVGIYIDADPNRLDMVRQKLFSSETVEYSVEERKIYILSTLLNDAEPVKLLALASDLKVTVSTISHDLDDLEPWITKRGLVLVRRRGYGVQITGSEIDKRRAISELILNHLDESDLFGKRQERTVSQVTEKLLDMIGREVVLIVENVLWQPDQKWLEDLAESEYMELLIQLSVSITRIRKGLRVNDLGIIASAIEANDVRTDMVNRMCVQLTELLDITFAEEERIYFLELLREAEDRSTRFLPLDDLVVLESVNRLIRLVEEKTGVLFHEDRLLREGLLSHMELVMKRLREGRIIRNPLLQQIKKDYESLFEIVREASAEMVNGMRVPDEEVGFLVMHFGASMERLRQFHREVRALVVCTSGIGSSRLLVSRLTKELPQIQIINRVSWYEATRIPEEDYDLIISTVDLPLSDDQYFKISPLLTEEESEALRHFIQNITLKRVKNQKRKPFVEEQGLKWLSGMREILDEIIKIVSGFEVYPLNNRDEDLKGSLLLMCKMESEVGVLNDPEQIANLLIEREQYGSQLIPDTSLALFHTRSEHILIPSLTLFRLEQPLLLDLASEARVQHVLLMLGPREISKESLEVLSEISALLLQEEMIILLEKGEKEEILHYLSTELSAFFRSKMEMRRTTR